MRDRSETAAVGDLKTSRQLSEREIAMNLVLELAESGLSRFSMLCAYDDDAEFIQGLIERLKADDNVALRRKIAKVVRRLVNFGVLKSQMQGTHKEYIGEPAKQRNYWLKEGKAFLLTCGESEHTNSPEWEASFLLRHAYPLHDDGQTND